MGIEESVKLIMEHVHEETTDSTIWLDAEPFKEFFREPENRNRFEQILLKHLNKRFSTNLKCEKCYSQSTGSFFSSFSSKYFSVRMSGLVWESSGCDETYGVVIQIRDTWSCCCYF